MTTEGFDPDDYLARMTQPARQPGRSEPDRALGVDERRTEHELVIGHGDQRATLALQRLRTLGHVDICHVPEMYVMQRTLNPVGLPDHELRAAVNTAAGVGGLRYMDGCGTWFSAGATSRHEQVCCHHMGCAARSLATANCCRPSASSAGPTTNGCTVFLRLPVGVVSGCLPPRPPPAQRPQRTIPCPR
jgi:hypothetical protein